MPLTRTDQPSALQKAFSGSTAILESALAPETVRLLQGSLSTLFFAGPIYSLTSAEILAGADLRRGHLVGWNFLVPDKAGQLASVELCADASGKPRPQSAVLVQGSSVDATALVVTSLGKMAEDETYTINLLRIPSLGFLAAWLRSERDEHDVFVPLAPTPPGINAAERYTEERLVEHLRALARYQAELGPEGDA